MRAIALHAAVLLALFAAQFVLSDYAHLMTTRIMVLACLASGYNLLFGYTGLLSLGHAMFFAAGLYGAGLTVFHLGWSVPAAFAAGIGAGAVAATVVGALALRTTGTAFMIVTLMIAQVGHLAITYFTQWTRGEEGLTLPAAARTARVAGATLDLADAGVRYNIALVLLGLTIAVTLAVARGRMGRVLIAIRENEARTLMLGYDTTRHKLSAMVMSGTISAMAGAAYALLFGYVGASFGAIQISIEALLFTLLGGAGTVLGPLLGTMILTWTIDVLSGVTSAYLLVVGVALVALVLFFPRGILGWVRDRVWPWLP